MIEKRTSPFGNARMLLLMGTGGVGKTTTSAVIATEAALRGQRVVVVTIDPSQRLKSLFGLDGSTEEPVPVSLPSGCRGSLSVLLPNTKHVFSYFLDKLTDDPSIKARILKNRIFQVFSGEFSGAQEYMALKRVEMLVASNAYDLIVVDTPPAENALEFLDAPSLLSRFFEEGLIQRLLGKSSKILSLGVQGALTVLKKLTSAQFFSDLIEFTSALFEVRGRFKENLDRIESALRAPTTHYWLVTTPRDDNLSNCMNLFEALKGSGRSLSGMILNRTLTSLPSSPPPHCPEWFQVLLQDEERILGSLKGNIPAQILMLPELNRDILSLEDLYEVSQVFRSLG